MRTQSHTLVLERQRLEREGERIAQALLTSGRKKRKIVDHAQKLWQMKHDYFGFAVVLDGAEILLSAKVVAQAGEQEFHCRFRMSDYMFDRIHVDIRDLVHDCSLFMGRPYAVGRVGPSSMQRMYSVIQQLAFGICSFGVKDYSGVGCALGRDCLYAFCKFIIRRYQHEYLGRWNKEGLIAETAANELRGFPGMIGSIDCSHWVWHRCPMAWQGMYQDRNHKRSVVVDAVAGHDTYFHQAFVGLPGSLNDLNIMARTDLQTKFMHSIAFDHPFILACHRQKGAYLLADGIYPAWTNLMRTIPMPVGENQKVFAKAHESVKKDVERAFGRLHAKWHVLKYRAMAQKACHLNDIWLCCIILHNMTLKDEKTKKLDRTAVTVYPSALDALGGLGRLQPMRDDAYYAAHSVTAMIKKRKEVENSGMSAIKQRALVEHVFLHSKKRTVRR